MNFLKKLVPDEIRLDLGARTYINHSRVVLENEKGTPNNVGLLQLNNLNQTIQKPIDRTLTADTAQTGVNVVPVDEVAAVPLAGGVPVPAPAGPPPAVQKPLTHYPIESLSGTVTSKITANTIISRKLEKIDLNIGGTLHAGVKGYYGENFSVGLQAQVEHTHFTSDKEPTQFKILGVVEVPFGEGVFTTKRHNAETWIGPRSKYTKTGFQGVISDCALIARETGDCRARIGVKTGYHYSLYKKEGIGVEAQTQNFGRNFRPSVAAPQGNQGLAQQPLGSLGFNSVVQFSFFILVAWAGSVQLLTVLERMVRNRVLREYKFDDDDYDFSQTPSSQAENQKKKGSVKKNPNRISEF